MRSAEKIVQKLKFMIQDLSEDISDIKEMSAEQKNFYSFARTELERVLEFALDEKQTEE